MVICNLNGPKPEKYFSFTLPVYVIISWWKDRLFILTYASSYTTIKHGNDNVSRNNSE